MESRCGDVARRRSSRAEFRPYLPASLFSFLLFFFFFKCVDAKGQRSDRRAGGARFRAVTAPSPPAGLFFSEVGRLVRGTPAAVCRDDIRALRREGTVGDVLTGELIGRSVGAEKKPVNLIRG